MEIWITGSHGFIGSAVRDYLAAAGYDMYRLVREHSDHPNDIQWNPETGELKTERVPDGLIHLAGVNLSSARWTSSFRKLIRSSRVDSTRRLCEVLTGGSRKPAFLLSASAVGFYGDRGNQVLVESEPCGNSFLSRVCSEWEQATSPAKDSGIRVVNLRFGLVLDSGGGALARMLPFFRKGLGGPAGSGNQYVSWITRHDVCRCLLYLVEQSQISGPVNICTSSAVSNRAFSRMLGKVLRRPAMFRLPRLAGRILFGGMFDEVIMTSIRAQPEVLRQSGFEFTCPELENALKAMLNDS